MDFKSWLNQRYEVDRQARNKEVESIFRARLSAGKITIVDIGAGTGSNLRYYHGRLSAQEQHWYLVDQEKVLLEETLANLDSEVNQCEENVWQLRHNQKDIVVHFVEADVFTNSIDPFLERADLILSNAFFDLASAVQLRDFLGKLDFGRQTFLSTINYTGMRFIPGDTEDGYWIDHYEEHMRRDRPEGRSTGPDCVGLIIEFFEHQDLRYHVGGSNWELKEGSPLIQGIFDFMYDAFMDMKLDMDAFARWRGRSKHATMIVEHEDLCVLAAH